MGSLQGTLSFTGSLSNISANTMRGHDKIILRTTNNLRCQLSICESDFLRCVNSNP